MPKKRWKRSRRGPVRGPAAAPERSDLNPDLQVGAFFDQVEKVVGYRGRPLLFHLRGYNLVVAPAEEVLALAQENESLRETLSVVSDSEAVDAIRAGLVDDEALDLDEVRRMVAEREE
ncbi:hypothetical protein AB0J77_03210 [Micromonospora tulbaghiae]|uniref:hypothetical protein n=1 Tax=Micromonospora tulbaghiae TaxID=479978 RepID=UPI0034440464